MAWALSVGGFLGRGGGEGAVVVDLGGGRKTDVYIYIYLYTFGASCNYLCR